MTRSQHGARISRFSENGFIYGYLTSKFLLLLIFIWALFWANFEQTVSWTNNSPQSSFYLFVFLSTLVHEIPIGTFFFHFWDVKNSKFWENGFKNEYFTSNFSLLLNFIILSPLVHEITSLGTEHLTDIRPTNPALLSCG